MSDDLNPPVEYDLVMPFVTVASKGGPHDDQAFTAGWECGVLDTRLQAMEGAACIVERWVMPELVPQVDLIAMKHGLAVRRAEQVEAGPYVRLLIGSPHLLDLIEAPRG